MCQEEGKICGSVQSSDSSASLPSAEFRFGAMLVMYHKKAASIRRISEFLRPSEAFEITLLSYKAKTSKVMAFTDQDESKGDQFFDTFSILVSSSSCDQDSLCIVGKFTINALRDFSL